MLTGGEALVRGLNAARVRKLWSFPGAPLTRVQLALDGNARSGHRFAVNEHVATSMALGGALLSGNNTCVLMQHVGVSVALDALASFGTTNELRSACVLVEGVDPRPRWSQTAQDNRAVLADLAHLAQLEAASVDESYHFARLAASASARTGMPVAVRIGPRALEHKASLNELPPDLQDGSATWTRSAGPFVATTATFRFHAEKRARRLMQLQPLIESLTVSTGGEGTHAVVVAGHLGARVHARSWSRRIPTLRLAAAWPLPRRVLIDFLRSRSSVLVLEEGQPFLEHALQAFCHREGLTCRVTAAGGARPTALDDDRVENVLTRFGGRVRAESEPTYRDGPSWRRCYDAAASISADDGEPWPLFVARTRPSMKGFAASDPRLTLLRALRALDRPTMIVGDPGNTGELGIRDKLVDVKMHMGSAAPIAGALADAVDVEERAGGGPPLAVALIGDTNHYHSELNGVLDNAIARREVLHVVVVNRRSEMTAGARTPYLADEALETQLRSAGMHVATAMLDDPGLGAAVAYAASRSGPRALICYAGAHGQAVDGESDG